jgi:hypothetical protein
VNSLISPRKTRIVILSEENTENEGLDRKQSKMKERSGGHGSRR